MRSLKIEILKGSLISSLKIEDFEGG